MRDRSRILAIAALGLLLVGCRAQVGAPDDLGDDLGGLDGGGGDGGQADLLSDASSCTGSAAVEICNNGCDDDGNGYTDLDDPACSTQLLVTLPNASSSLSRLILDPVPHLAVLDQNPVGNGAMAMLDRHLAANVAYLVFTAGTSIERLTLSATGTGTPAYNMAGFATRDLCAFGGELIVVERGMTSLLHRFAPDGQTSLGTVPLGNVFATACASDGSLLYVAVHDQLVGPSTFLAFDSTYLQQGAALPLPQGIANFGNGLDRCIDFAYSPRSGFWGLFVNAFADYPGNPSNDNLMNGGQLFPFAFDGGSGAPVDAGTFHGVGAFLP